MDEDRLSKKSLRDGEIMAAPFEQPSFKETLSGSNAIVLEN